MEVVVEDAAAEDDDDEEVEDEDDVNCWKGFSDGVVVDVVEGDIFLLGLTDLDCFFGLSFHVWQISQTPEALELENVQVSQLQWPAEAILILKIEVLVWNVYFTD